MKPYLEWLEEDGFHVQNAWSIEKGEWLPDGNLELFEHQKRILGHCLTPGPDGKLPYTTIVYSDIKKSGKTTIGASVAVWAAEEGFPPGSEIYLIANDFDQASYRMYGDVQNHIIYRGVATPTAKGLKMPNGSTIMPIAQQYTSAAGARQAVTLWDELWGFMQEKTRRMWAEMTPPPTVPNAFRFIVTYAGFENESDLLMDVYKKGFENGTPVPGLEDIVDDGGEPVCRENGKIFVYWNTVPRMPWQTPEYYEEQAGTLRASDFLRMHKNRWVTSQEAFIPIEWWDRCVVPGAAPLTVQPDNPFRRLPVSIGVDIGLKHDCSAIVGVVYDSIRSKAILAFHKIWYPDPGTVLDLEETVEAELIRMKAMFYISAVLYDPSQFQRSAVTLVKKGFPMVEFPQTEAPMITATSTFFSMISTKALEIYPADDLRDHIKYSTAVSNSRGARLQKGKNANNKIDAAVALAMALYHITEKGGVDLGHPIIWNNPFNDGEVPSGRRIRTIEELKLPPELRNGPDYVKHVERTGYY